MGVKLELTAITPQLMDSVIYMDNSPAYAAFKEEIEAILAEFNEKKSLSANWTVDPGDLTSKSEDTLKNMHRAYLYWSFAEQKDSPEQDPTSVYSMVKLFFKSQQQNIMDVNGGSSVFDTVNAERLIDAFKEKISSDSAVYDSVKAFFKGYVYGYYFNFLEEAVVMKKYAEMLAYLGVMSGIVPTSVSDKQKVLVKIAPLMTDNRCKYVSGLLPMDLMLDMIYKRIDMTTLPEERAAHMRNDIRSYVTSHYKTDRDDGMELVSDSVSSQFVTLYFSKYVDSHDVADALYSNAFSGVRTFLDGDRDDTGEFDAAKLNSLMTARLEKVLEPFYTAGREPLLDTSLGGEEKCYRYPVIYKDGDRCMFANAYAPYVYKELDGDVYVSSDVPDGIFDFADAVFSSEPVCEMFDIADSTVRVRRDKVKHVEEIKRLNADESLSARDRRMLLLEQYLYLCSGSLTAQKFRNMTDANVFGTELFDAYIKYRADLLIDACGDREAKKTLLDNINSISK